MEIKIPEWADPSKYKYDLGMSRYCHNCGAYLVDGQIVFEDVDDPGVFYCSRECILRADRILNLKEKLKDV